MSEIILFYTLDLIFEVGYVLYAAGCLLSLFITSLPINRVLLAARFFIDRVIFGIYFEFAVEAFEGVGREPSKVFFMLHAIVSGFRLVGSPISEEMAMKINSPSGSFFVYKNKKEALVGRV